MKNIRGVSDILVRILTRVSYMIEDTLNEIFF